ncbi:MAG TPA: hypothetical protein VJU87_06180 [Gemmatimonadaceae bacterium]|nr:hypothetical protein [Gemmatimonadaceae bacterium]
MSRKIPVRLRAMVMAAMFCVVGAGTVQTSSANDAAGSTHAGVPTTSLSGYIIAVG